MPTITPVDQDTALRLQRSIDTANLEPPESDVVVRTPNHGNVFLVSDELMTAYEADLVANPQAPASPNCRSGSPCYAAQCADPPDEPPPPPPPADEYELPISFTAKIVVTGFGADASLLNGPPNATFTLDWGDGTTVPVQLDGNGDWNGSHTFASAADYVLTLHDDDGPVGSRTVIVPSS